jgi:hypothetical protein
VPKDSWSLYNLTLARMGNTEPSVAHVVKRTALLRAPFKTMM